ncbi:MAG TPA: hypothetical protein VIS49_13125 [Cyclobacteriaceae bacterium]
MRASILAKFITLVSFAFLLGCSSDDIGEPVVDCSKSSLSIALTSSIDASGCATADGSFVVTASGGKSPYTYSLNATTNSSGSFNGLALGSYEVKVVDADQCERLLSVDILATGATLQMQFVVVQDSECLTNNGSIDATASGGTPPYEFSLNGGTFGSSSTFTSLMHGNYTVEVKDSQNCVFIKNASVPRGNTGVSFAAQIQPIINTKCAITGCHNGDNGAARNWTVYDNVKTNAANIKTRTGNGSMPLNGSLTQEQINLIACWVDDGALNN